MKKHTGNGLVTSFHSVTIMRVRLETVQIRMTTLAGRIKFGNNTKLEMACGSLSKFSQFLLKTNKISFFFPTGSSFESSKIQSNPCSREWE